MLGLRQAMGVFEATHATLNTDTRYVHDHGTALAELVYLYFLTLALTTLQFCLDIDSILLHSSTQAVTRCRTVNTVSELCHSSN